MNVDLGGNTLRNGYFAGIVLNGIWLVKSGAYTCVAGDKIQADTRTASFTITLPNDILVGSAIFIEDAGLSWDVHNLTVARNGNLINGVASDFTANVVGGKVSAVFCGGTIGWSIK